MRFLMVMLVGLFLSACGGYKPAPVYASDVFDNPVIVKVKLDPEDPSSGTYLQDTIAQIVVNRLNLTITKNVNEAKNYIVVNSYTVNTSPTNYDKNGNVIRYSVNAAIEFAIKDKMGFWSKNIVSSEFVNVGAQTTLGSSQKDKAAKIAINKALDAFVVAVMQRSKKFKEQKANKKEKQIEANVTQTEDIQMQSDTRSDDAVSSEDAASNEDTISGQDQISNEDESSNEVITPINQEENLSNGTSVIPSKEDEIFNAKELQNPLDTIQ